MRTRDTLLALSLMVWACCSVAQKFLPPEQRAKTTQEILERAGRGEPQELSVLLDDRDVRARAAQRRQAKGLQYNDDDLDEIRARELDALKQEAIPKGEPGLAVIRSFRNFAIVIVQVRNEKALARLLASAKVRRVSDATKPYPLQLNQSLPLIQQPTALKANITGAGYRIAVLDGVPDYTAPSFSRSKTTGCRRTTDTNLPTSWPLIGSSDCVLSNVLNFGDPAAGADHGTSSAGIAARTAPGIKIDSLGVLAWYRTATGLGYYAAGFSQVIGALDWVYTNQNKAPAPIVAVNMSFGSNTPKYGECGDTEWGAAISDVRERGIIPVVASGNGGYKNAVSEPACGPGAVRVGMVYDQDFADAISWNLPLPQPSSCTDSAPRKDQVPCGSNSSNLLTILAPGAMVDVDLIRSGGTSAAAPFVAASIALMKQAFPADSVDQAVLRLTSSGRQIRDSANGISRPRLDLAAALSTGLLGGGTNPGTKTAGLRVTTTAVPLLLFNP